MAFLVRCPSCIELPDGTIVRCRYPRRMEANGHARCAQCRVHYYACGPSPEGWPAYATEDW